MLLLAATGDGLELIPTAILFSHLQPRDIAKFDPKESSCDIILYGYAVFLWRYVPIDFLKRRVEYVCGNRWV